MTKTLKDFYEVYKPQSPDEQRFIDKHVVVKHPDAAGNGDDVFNASKVKYTKRKKDRHGYEPGEDEKVYEDVEQVDELARETVRKYYNKAGMDGKNAASRLKIGGGDWSGGKDTQTVKKRAKGREMALRRRSGQMPTSEEWSQDELDILGEAFELLEKTLTPAEMKKREEIVLGMKKSNPGMDKSAMYAIATAKAKDITEGLDRIDELSNKTLASYATSAVNDVRNANQAKIRWRNDPHKVYSGLHPNTGEWVSKSAKEMEDQHDSVARRREKGVKMAIKKLAKEEVINKAVERFAPKPTVTLEERFATRIQDIEPKFADLLNDIFENLNEENQKAMIDVASTDAGLKSLIDFALQNRGN